MRRMSLGSKRSNTVGTDDMSRIEENLRAAIASYLAGALSWQELRDQQIDISLEAERTSDRAAMDIAYELELLAAERLRGHREEASLRDELARFAAVGQTA